MASNGLKPPEEAVVSQIAGYIRVGADYQLAAAAAGVRPEIAQAWLEKAKKAWIENAGDAWAEFYHAIHTSQAQAEIIALQRLSAEGGAAGAKWLLEKVKGPKNEDDISGLI